MMRRKNNTIVGLTTFDNENLKISIPALSKLRQKFTLIIYNDNPLSIVSRRQIRKLGYCGDLKIINSNESVGELCARIEIINSAREQKPDWFVFCDDDDLLIDIDIPQVSADNFAIIQNSVTLKHRLSNLLRVMTDTNDFEIDDENVKLIRPNLGLVGTPIRSTLLFGLVKIIPDIINDIQKINNEINYYPPVKAMLWGFINIYAKYINPNANPIYMDKISYIKNDIDTATTKYGCLSRPIRNAEDAYNKLIVKYNKLFKNVLSSDAALRG